jgi:septum formation protein
MPEYRNDDDGVPPLVLASRSPRRVQLLEMLGLRFRTDPADLEEEPFPGEDALVHAERLAREKAEHVLSRNPGHLVIGSDTVVILDGELLGKPGTPEEAVEMLLRLQGREHRVGTGIAVADPSGRVETSVVSVLVRFRPFRRRTAEEYVRTGEPLDKAGAYGIQGYGATIIEEIEGDFFAVMGLPVSRMISLFRALGWRYNFHGFEPL